jgi:hypothetical protein
MEPCLLEGFIFQKPLFSPDILAMGIKYSYHLINTFIKSNGIYNLTSAFQVYVIIGASGKYSLILYLSNVTDL